MKHRKLRCLCESAVLLAAAMILNYLRLWKMPWGGSIDLAMIPVLLCAVRWGIGPGLCAGFLFGTLQFLLGGGFAIGWQSILGDYLIAYTVLGLAGFAKKTRNGYLLGTLLGGGARFLVHYVVGATIWAEYMPDEFFGLTMTSPWFYSLLYNGSFMIPNIILAMLAFFLLWKPLQKFMSGQDLS